MLEGRNEIRDGGHHCGNYGEVSCVVQLSNFIRRLSRIQTESLGSHTDIENWRPATRVGNWPDVDQNPENRDSEIPQRLANSRECRANFFEPDIASKASHVHVAQNGAEERGAAAVGGRPPHHK
jgi:hypothetical protein